MKKKYLPHFLILTLAFPQIALAHFESPHEPFWHEPMHFFLQHYYGLALIAIGLISIIVAVKKKAK